MGELRKIVEFVESNVILKKLALRRMSLIVGEDVTKVTDESAADPRRIGRFREAAEEITRVKMDHLAPVANTKLTLPIVEDDRTGESTLFGHVMVFHCHNYNVVLQRTIEDPAYIDGKALLVNAAEEVTFVQFRDYFEHLPKMSSPSQRLEIAERLFRECGFGLIGFDRVDQDGGIVVAPVSHYAVGWKAKFGERKTPGCFFVCGFIAGAMEAAYNAGIGSYDVTELRCVAAGDDEDRFQVKRIGHGG
jgi:predicted hydrocarbon binding protein